MDSFRLSNIFFNFLTYLHTAVYEGYLFQQWKKLFSVYKSMWMFKLLKCFIILWDESCYINVKYSVIIYYFFTHSKCSWDVLFVVVVVMVLCDLALHFATAHKDLFQKKLD